MTKTPLCRRRSNQLQTYKQQIPALFHTNAVLLTSDGMMARIGSLSADEERFMPWRTIDGLSVAPKGTPELSVLTEGVFERRRFLDIIRYCTVFLEKDGLIKILAGYHQFHAVRHAVDCTVKASLPQGDKRAGVIWHTQGSGKSLLMAFLCRAARPASRHAESHACGSYRPQRS